MESLPVETVQECLAYSAALRSAALCAFKDPRDFEFGVNRSLSELLQARQNASYLIFEDEKSTLHLRPVTRRCIE